jgi:dolichol-phosphate mannosyltransferase
MKPEISIILPTFNEAGHILNLIAAIEERLKPFHYEIIVVDDSSNDGTQEIIANAKCPSVALIARNQQRGYAKSICCGIEHSKGNILVIMDSDFNHDPKELPGMLEGLKEYDCVSGSRFLKGGHMSPFWRSLMSQAMNIFIRQQTASVLTDHTFGFFVLKRSCLKDISFDQIFYGFGDYGIRLLYDLQKRSVRILELPARCGLRATGQSHNNFIKTFVQYVGATLALRKR